MSPAATPPPRPDSIRAPPPPRTRPARPYPAHHAVQSAPAVIHDTPYRKRDLSQISGDGQWPSSREDLYAGIFHEVKHHVYVNVPSFTDALFGKYSDKGPATQLYTEAVRRGDYDVQRQQWSKFPHFDPCQNLVTAWLERVVNPLLQQVAGPDDVFSFSAAPGNYNFTGTPADLQRRADVVVSGLCAFPPGAATHDWRNVRVFGGLNGNASRDLDTSTILQLADYARCVFFAQPLRRAVHAFSLCGSLLRCWMIDRMGMLSSALIDINAEPLAFLRAALFYTTADPVSLGFDPSATTAVLSAGGQWIHRADSPVYDPTVIWIPDLGRTVLPCIEVPTPPHSEPDAGDAGGRAYVRLLLQPAAILSTAGVVSRGTACWRARRLDATTTSTTTITTTTPDAWPLVVKRQWRDEARESEGLLLRQALGTRGVAQYWSHQDVADWASGRPVDVLSIVRNDLTVPADCRKRFRFSDLTTGSKRRKLSHGKNHSSDSKDDAVIQNRVLTTLVTKTVGTPLGEFSKFSQLLGAFDDAIRGHRALLEDLHILHRDISMHNIMLDDDPQSPHRGFLIDLDFAIEVSRVKGTNAVHRTGTPPFMAIDVLLGEKQNKPHTYRHDLESFLYVLLWVCTFYTGLPGRPLDRDECIGKTLGTWSTLTWMNQANMKLATMNFTIPFEMLLDEFDPAFDDFPAFANLAREWRRVLFPPNCGTDTYIPDDPADLYEPMLAAVADALDAVGDA